MSQISSTTSSGIDRAQLDRLCTAIRGKLQFMDYLVRAAVADVERYETEGDAGTRIFLRQLIEMHSASLAVESENVRLVGELCGMLDNVLDPETASTAPFRNGDAA